MSRKRRPWRPTAPPVSPPASGDWRAACSPALAERLAALCTDDEAARWFRLPQPLLGDRLPVDLIAEGREGDLVAVLDRLLDGGVSVTRTLERGKR